MDLKEVECEHVVFIPLAKNMDKWRSPLNTAMKLRVPLNRKFADQLSHC
jgi:hypothetical protein